MNFPDNLIAFFNGKQIQYRAKSTKIWRDMPRNYDKDFFNIRLGDWQDFDLEYRIKPQILYYRTALMFNAITSKYYTISKSYTNNEFNQDLLIHDLPEAQYIKWLDDINIFEIEADK